MTDIFIMILFRSTTYLRRGVWNFQNRTYEIIPTKLKY